MSKKCEIKIKKSNNVVSTVVRQLPTHQAIQLADGRLAGLADVPHFDAAFPAGVHVLGGRGDGDRADHLAVRQGRHLTRVTGDPWAHQRVGGKRHGLHLTLRRYVERIRSAKQLQ